MPYAKTRTITIAVREDGTMRVFEPYVPYGGKTSESLETDKVLWVVEELYRRIDRLREELGVVVEEKSIEEELGVISPDDYPEMCETYGCMSDSTTTSSEGARLCDEHFLKAEDEAHFGEEEDNEKNGELDVSSQTYLWLGDGLYSI